MLDDQKQNISDNLQKSKRIIDVLKKSRSENGDHFHEDFSETELRSIFKELTSDEKLMLLYEAILSNAVIIADSDRKLDFFKKTESISIMTWFKKVVIVAFAFTGAVALCTFIFIAIKNGALNDISFVASFLKTINEVLNVIFLTR